MCNQEIRRDVRGAWSRVDRVRVLCWCQGSVCKFCRSWLAL